MLCLISSHGRNGGDCYGSSNDTFRLGHRLSDINGHRCTHQPNGSCRRPGEIGSLINFQSYFQCFDVVGWAPGRASGL